MKLPFLVAPEFDLSLFAEIKPQFPNWEKSFVSGANSPLYRVSHLIHSVRKTLLLTRVTFLAQAEGPPGNVHGGATAGLVDETMGVVVWHQGERCLTQKLELHYGKLLPLTEEAFVFTEIVASNVKTLEVHTTIYSADVLGTDAKEGVKEGDKTKTPRVSAQGVFHRLNDEQMAHFRNKLKT